MVRIADCTFNGLNTTLCLTIHNNNFQTKPQPAPGKQAKLVNSINTNPHYFVTNSILIRHSH